MNKIVNIVRDTESIEISVWLVKYVSDLQYVELYYLRY